jgi:gluconate kinase
MLQSQFEALEEPTDALTFDVSMPVEEIVQGILASISV